MGSGNGAGSEAGEGSGAGAGGSGAGSGAGMGRDIASLTFVNLYEDDVCVVCGPDHPAARLKKPGYARLAQCDWVLQRISSSVRQALTEAFLRQGLLLPHPVVETPTYTQALDIVAATRLLTAAPRHTA
ncbi:LysR substrate-binding domain protein, partial [Bordetella bronchiseptica D993]